MVVLGALATAQPAGLGPKADPLATPEVIKPEWFFFVAFRWLKLFSAAFAVLSMGLILCAMFVWPWLDAVLRRITKREDVGAWIGAAVMLVVITMTVWEAAVRH
jgi:quinol-cytochrome oxidoreductase complex cytochrome b subunit